MVVDQLGASLLTFETHFSNINCGLVRRLVLAFLILWFTVMKNSFWKPSQLQDLFRHIPLAILPSETAHGLTHTFSGIIQKPYCSSEPSGTRFASTSSWPVAVSQLPTSSFYRGTPRFWSHREDQVELHRWSHHLLLHAHFYSSSRFLRHPRFYFIFYVQLSWWAFSVQFQIFLERYCASIGPVLVLSWCPFLFLFELINLKSDLND